VWDDPRSWAQEGRWVDRSIAAVTDNDAKVNFRHDVH
jgi:hypothetical protein